MIYVLLVSSVTLQTSVEYIQTSENLNGFAYPFYDKNINEVSEIYLFILAVANLYRNFLFVLCNILSFLHEVKSLQSCYGKDFANIGWLSLSDMKQKLINVPTL